jgi:hypothetical protein
MQAHPDRWCAAQRLSLLFASTIPNLTSFPSPKSQLGLAVR